MKLSHLLAVLALPLIAQAQTVTPDACGALAKGVTIAMTANPAMEFKCAPANLGGTGSIGQFAHQNGGIVSWNYCTDGFSYHWQIGVMKDALLTDQTIYADWMAVEFADDKVAALNAFKQKHVTLPLTDPTMTPIWCPSIKAIMAGVPPPTPYVVMPNPAGTTQPIYSIDKAFGGVRSAKPIGLVNPKRANGTQTKCDCMTNRVVEGSQAYCGISAMPLAVTACVKQ